MAMIGFGFSCEEGFLNLYNSYKETDKGLELLKLEGISPDKLDVGEMSRRYATQRAADVSIDTNANANEDKSINNYQSEVTKGLLKLEGYYLLWKYTKKRFGVDRADQAIKAIWDGAIYFHDASGHGIQAPYSYLGDTSVLVKVNGEQSLMSMDALYNKYAGSAEIAKDRTFINNFVSSQVYGDVSVASRVDNIEVYRGDRWVKVNQIQKHLKHNKLLAISTEDGRTTVVTEDHPVVLGDGTTKHAGSILKGDTLATCDSIVKYTPNLSVATELAYVVGMYLGDGHKSQYRYSITQNQGSEFERLVQSAESVGIRVRVDPSRENRVHLIGATQALDSLCLGENSFTKRLPVDILNWDKKAIIALICGVYDAEGSLSGNAMTIRVSNFALASQMAEVLKVIGCDYVTLNAREVKQSRSGFKGNTNIIYCLSFLPSECDLKVFKMLSVKLADYTIDYTNSKFRNKQQLGVVKKVIALETQLPYFDYVYDISVDGELFYSNGMIQHNCFAYSTTPLMLEGRQYGQLKSSKAKRSDSFVAQVTETTMDLSQDFMGAIAPADFLVNLSYFLKKEGVDLDTKEGTDYVINLWQKFIHVMNNKFRISGQSPSII